MKISPILAYFQYIKEQILDIVLPRDEKTEKLEKMSLLDWKNLMSVGTYEGVMYFFAYQDETVRQAIWEIKYRNNEKIKDNFSELISDYLQEDLSEKMELENFSNPILTSIPMHNSRIRTREFNQSEDLAKSISNNLKLQFKKVILKQKETARQTTLPRSKRMINVKNSFRLLNGADVKEKNFIVVDDVVTTGATMKELRKTLLDGGARKVFCVALAH